MSNAVLKGHASGTGTVTLETPNTNSDRTISLPDAAGTVMVSGNMPAFLAYANASQTISNATGTKVIYQAEAFDTNNCFDSTTNYRFTPNVAGYYQVTAGIYWNVSIGGELLLYIYKNGSSYIRLNDLQAASGTSQPYCFNGSSLVYLNGSTDYIEIYCSQSSGGSKSTGNQSVGDTVGPTNFQAFLVRAA